MIRKLCLCLVLLTLGCRAQGPGVSDADVNRRVERHVRAMVQAPGYVNIHITGRKPSSDMPGWDIITVTLAAGDTEKPVDFLISKDNKTLLSVNRFDLTIDPYEATMKKIDVAGRPVRGNKDAKVTVVVYDDYQCPYCSRFHQTVLESLKTYGDRVKFIYKDYPLFDIHPWAGRAAINSQCLAAQSGEAYWEFTDYVHANGPEISGVRGTAVEKQFAALDKVAMDLGQKHAVDAVKLAVCIKDQAQDKLDASVAEARRLGVDATPAFYVNGMKSGGAVPPAEFNAMLDRALADAGVAAAKPAGSN
jgi:protein-disulfide isomerase